MSRLDEIGERDGWRCWLCDEPIDPDASVNDSRGPSVDSVISRAKSKAKGEVDERLAHRGCNTKKGAVTPICLLYTSPSPRDGLLSRMPSSA